VVWGGGEGGGGGGVVLGVVKKYSTKKDLSEDSYRTYSRTTF